MVRTILACVLATALAACTEADRPADPSAGPVAADAERPELARHFDAFGAVGSFVLLEEPVGRWTVFDPERAERPVLPASTFKIFNSMAALETGVVGVDDVVPWDGVERSIAAWNHDQRMREAFQRSTVWFYQELARRIGEARMQALLEREGYGNRNPGGGIDQFWLTGDLRISPREQVGFLKRIRDREVGFPPEVVDRVEELLVLERCSDPAYALRGKTGWAQPEGRHLGWLVGWVEAEDRVHFYALNVESGDPDFPMIQARSAILRGILDELGVLPATCGE